MIQIVNLFYSYKNYKSTDFLSKMQENSPIYSNSSNNYDYGQQSRTEKNKLLPSIYNKYNSTNKFPCNYKATAHVARDGHRIRITCDIQATKVLISHTIFFTN